MALQNEKDLLYTPSPQSRTTFNGMEARDPLAADLYAGRTVQQSIVPTGIKQRQVGQVIVSAPALGTPGIVVNRTPSTITNVPVQNNGVVLAATMAASTYLVQTFFLKSTTYPNATVLAVPDSTLYINSIATANQYPFGSTFTPPNVSYDVKNDWGLSDNAQTATRVVIINAGATQFDAYVVIRWRIVISSQAAGGTNTQ